MCCITGAISLGREPNNKFPESIAKKFQTGGSKATRKTCLNKIAQTPPIKGDTTLVAYDTGSGNRVATLQDGP